MEDIKCLLIWSQGKNLLLNISENKELTVDYRIYQRGATTFMFYFVSLNKLWYLGIHITQDLSYVCPFNIQVKNLTTIDA